jgi:hypothetical protein
MRTAVTVITLTVGLAASASYGAFGDILSSWPSPKYPATMDANGLAFEGEYIWIKGVSSYSSGVLKCTKAGSLVNEIGFTYHAMDVTDGLAFDGIYLWTIYHLPNGTPTYDCYYKFTTNGSYAGGFRTHPGTSGYSISLSWDGQCLWTDERYHSPIKAEKYTTAGSLVGTFAIAPNWNTAAGYYNHQLWAGGDDGYIYGMAIGASTLAGSFAAPGGSCAAVGFDGEYLWTADKNTPQYIYKVDIDVVDVEPDSFGKIKGIYR